MRYLFHILYSRTGQKCFNQDKGVISIEAVYAALLTREDLLRAVESLCTPRDSSTFLFLLFDFGGASSTWFKGRAGVVARAGSV